MAYQGLRIVLYFSVEIGKIAGQWCCKLEKQHFCCYKTMLRKIASQFSHCIQICSLKNPKNWLLFVTHKKFSKIPLFMGKEELGSWISKGLKNADSSWGSPWTKSFDDVQLLSLICIRKRSLDIKIWNGITTMAVENGLLCPVIISFFECAIDILISFCGQNHRALA